MHPGFDRTRSNESYGSTTQESSEDSEAGRGVQVEVGMDGSVTRSEDRPASGIAAAGKKGKETAVMGGSAAKKRKSAGRR
jgi:hypothetical protein